MKPAACVLVAILGASGLALADSEDVPPVSEAPEGQFSVMRGVQGPKGMFHARLLLHINLSEDNVAKPISLAPDLYYAITRRSGRRSFPTSFSSPPGRSSPLP
jgi:hypothetical protein